MDCVCHLYLLKSASHNCQLLQQMSKDADFSKPIFVSSEFFCCFVSFTCKIFASYVFVVVCGLEGVFCLSLISIISCYCRVKTVLLLGKSVLICFEVYRIINSGFNYKS